MAANGNGGWNLTAVEAPLLPRPPAPPPAPQVEREPPKPDTTSPFELSRTYVPLTEAQTKLGWELMWKENTSSQVIFHIRRRNPYYKIPDVEKE